MSSDNEDLSPSGIPSQLTSSVSSLRQTLSPLLNKPWSDSVDKLSALKRAEMDVMMAYTLVDLVWVYLKTRGIDPTTHPVTAELERVKGYYAKLEEAQRGPSKPKSKLDIPAAQRFINHALPRAQRSHLPASVGGAEAGAEAPTSAAQAAALGAARAVAEQDAELARLAADNKGLRFKAERFRHFATGEAERILPGRGDGIAEEEEKGGVMGFGADIGAGGGEAENGHLDVDVDMERDQAVNNDEEAEAFLKGLQEEMDAAPQTAPAIEEGAGPAAAAAGASAPGSGSEVREGKGKTRGKRKRPSAV